MKLRLGFCSNSSSSSFICNACGKIESDWDATLEDAGMIQCHNGHTFCDSHVKGPIKELTDQEKLDFLHENAGDWAKNHYSRLFKHTRIATMDEDEFQTMEDVWRDEEFGTVPPENCPVCNFTFITEEHLWKYLKSEYKVTEETIRKWLKEND